ncbi:MAG: response regulator transcription factor [Desulfitobacteriia bacterium]
MVKSMPEALKLLTKTDYLLVVIIADNIEYLQHLKLMRDMKPMPILVLSSKYNAFEKLEAIRLGADEYLAYPSTVEEGVASGRALIRRYTVLNHQAKQPLTIITSHEIFICVEYRKLFLKSKEIELTRKEFDLLHLLFSNIGRVYTHEQIYSHVWAEEKDSRSENYAVWCLVARVRKKLRSVPKQFEYIKTVRDVGYCIDIVLR